VQAGNEHLPRRIVEVLGHCGAVLGDQPTDGVVPVDDRRLPLRVREHQPEDVAVLERDRLDVVEEARVDAVVGEQVEPGVDHHRRQWLELIDQRLDGRAERLALVGDRGRREAGEREQVGVLVDVELQSSCDRVQDLSGGVDVAPLLEPRVPGDADPR
jgi:hypothetical protein